MMTLSRIHSIQTIPIGRDVNEMNSRTTHWAILDSRHTFPSLTEMIETNDRNRRLV